jgi:hypothetical protein
MTWWNYASRTESPFRPAPRKWSGQMCGIRLNGAPAVPGGAADPSLILSWFYDRYSHGWRAKIREAWKAKGYTHVLLSWPDSREFGQTPQQFRDTCVELITAGFYPCPMFCSKDYDPADVFEIMRRIMDVLPLLVGVIPLACVGWELSIWLSPTQVQELIDWLAPLLTPSGCRVYVHFQMGYASFQQPGGVFADFWNRQVGKLTGLLHQRDLNWNHEETRYRYVDILDRFAGGFGCTPDSGFGHPFDCVGLELTAADQFNGQMSEAQGDDCGSWVIYTPGSLGPLGPVTIQGSGNGWLR